MTARKRLLRPMRCLAPLALAAAIAVPALTHAAPMGGWVGTEADRMAPLPMPVNVPTWESHGDAFPGCEPNEPILYDELGVVFLDGTTGRLPFGEAFERNESGNPAMAVWVVAGCSA